MTVPVLPARLLEAGIVLLFVASTLPAQSLLAGLQAESDPHRRSEKALLLANAAFEEARDFYHKGDIDKGDAELDNMTKALGTCVDSLKEAHKGRFYKKAELDVADLQRRLSGLMDDLSVQRRGWAEFTSRKLEQIHEKLLDGVMSK